MVVPRFTTRVSVSADRWDEGLGAVWALTYIGKNGEEISEYGNLLQSEGLCRTYPFFLYLIKMEVMLTKSV